MNQLIQIKTSPVGETETQTVNARELHTFLEVKSEFRNWIKNRIEDFGFEENQDFVTAVEIYRGGERKDYHLTLDMAKELAMVERNEKGKQARQYFIECERKSKEVVALNPANLSRIQLIEMAMQAEQERIALENTVQELKPKVEAFDRIANTDGSFCIRDAAKTLQIPEKRLMQFLIEKKWVYRRPMGTGYLAYADRIQFGLLEHKVTTGEKSDGSSWTNTQARVTAKGLAKLADLLGNAVSA